MPSRSPTLEGFKTVFRRPSLAFAEIIWRWCIGFAAAALLTFGFVEYLDTLPVTPQNMLLLHSRQPALIARALGRIVQGTGLRFLEACLVLSIALAVAWVIVASLGRAATLKALQSGSSASSVSGKSWRISSLIGLNGLRAALTLACAIGLLGAILLGERVTSAKNPSPGKAVLVFFAVSTLVTIGWLALNWFLSLASLFVVARGEDAFGAIAAAGDLCRARFGAVLAVSVWFWMAHLVAFVVASSAATVPVAFLAVLPGRLVVGGLVLLALLYFAVVDCLYAGRLAAYLYIAESPDDVIVPRTFSPEVPNHPSISPASDRVDPDDLILSDLPHATAP